MADVWVLIGIPPHRDCKDQHTQLVRVPSAELHEIQAYAKTKYGHLKVSVPFSVITFLLLPNNFTAEQTNQQLLQWLSTEMAKDTTLDVWGTLCASKRQDEEDTKKRLAAQKAWQERYERGEIARVIDVPNEQIRHKLNELSSEQKFPANVLVQGCTSLPEPVVDIVHQYCIKERSWKEKYDARKKQSSSTLAGNPAAKRRKIERAPWKRVGYVLRSQLLRIANEVYNELLSMKESTLANLTAVAEFIQELAQLREGVFLQTDSYRGNGLFYCSGDVLWRTQGDYGYFVTWRAWPMMVKHGLAYFSDAHMGAEFVLIPPGARIRYVSGGDGDETTRERIADGRDAVYLNNKDFEEDFVQVNDEGKLDTSLIRLY